MFILGSAESDVPRNSLDFSNGTMTGLSMSGANFGTIDNEDFAVSLWFRRTSGSIANSWLFVLNNDAPNPTMQINTVYNNLSNETRLSVSLFRNGVTDGQLDTLQGGGSGIEYFPQDMWVHVMVEYIKNRAGDDLRSYINGVEPSYSTNSQPTAAPVPIDEGPAYWGNRKQEDGNAKGQIYQPAILSPSPGISAVYDAGNPVPLIGQPGLHSLVRGDNDVNTDSVLSAEWTNNNGVVLAPSIP